MILTKWLTQKIINIALANDKTEKKIFSFYCINTLYMENVVRHFPDFYIMQLLWLHPEALPDSIPRQGVCSQWTDGIFQSYRCRYTFQWLLLLP